MTDKDFILTRHPRAFVCFNADNGTHKVYQDRETGIALSASVVGESAAWSDAARAIREREDREVAQDRKGESNE